ncbi:guanylate-binding protein 1-like [Sinocyclocheilus anshuiensis]|uniref:guanylate-binding protein 1-like n=1 Tax=Sinocyclocheilus anshuiensis TaxID=1608454 RepID=UPI0007B806B8|nr:PREDICTED: guanylate-binding protein 1-like [Sinocyclocheilus anshuiensis]
MPAPVCLIENDENGRLCVRKEAKDILDEINEPVVVVSVVGLYRTGKSYLMNHLAGQQSGFALGSTIESKTKGIWMWCVPHPNKEGHTLVLLDTEGLGDVAKKEHYVVELAEHIKIRSTEAADDEEEEEDSEFVRFFPSFIWVVRDFTLDLEIDGKKVTDDDYLEFALNLRKGVSKKIRDYNLPGECIKRYFPSRKCFVFPFPANSHQDMTRLEILQDQDLAQQFLEVTGHFCDYMFVNSDVKRLKGGHIVTGRLLGPLVEIYVDTISSGEVPCLDNAVVVLANLENQTAVQEALKVYQGGMEELKKTLPISIEKLTCEHQKFSSLAIAKFTKRSFKDEKNEYLKTLEVTVSMCYTDLLEENKMASERKCRDLLKNLSSDMSKRLQDGEYSQSGGYELYCRDRDAIVEQYRREPNKGIRAEAVLEEFLKEREPEANSILCMDNKLTENEKQMNKEKENAALLKQKLKEEEEKRIESEKMMETEKVRHEDRVKQMQESFNKEKEQQQQEMDRAIESKLKEREEMLKKGFKDEAYNLKEEIKKLKDEKERSHGGGGIFKDYVMPFLCPLVETVPNLLMQRSMMKSLKKGLKC